MDNELKNAVYLGDGAYARWEDDRLILFTHNGIYQTNSVCLEPEVLASLLKFLEVKHG